MMLTKEIIELEACLQFSHTNCHIILLDLYRLAANIIMQNTFNLNSNGPIVVHGLKTASEFKVRVSYETQGNLVTVTL